MDMWSGTSGLNLASVGSLVEMLMKIWAAKKEETFLKTIVLIRLSQK